MKAVVWGVLSTARIGVEKVIPAMQRSPWVEVRGIASRALPAAQTAARRLGIPRAYGSYEALIADPDIEAIYNPLPNHLHVPLTLAAAAAGKHVLCEKPIALSADEARTLREAAGRVRIAEAFMVRHHPQWQRVRELLRSGRIGTPRIVQAAFSYFNDDPANIRNQADLAGAGALYDIGCYAIVTARHVFEAEPLRAVALVDRDPALRVDRSTSGLLDFGAGRQLSFSVSMQSCPHQRVTVLGTHGRIEVVIPFNAPQGAATQIRIDDGGALDGSGITVETLPQADQYQRLVEDFSRNVRGESAPFWGLDDAIAQMAVIDALWRSERSGAWERV
ncbi:MAG TPA: Gfo/Idh/MocA family oxidoreductase [Piscinibacter sp.]|uniref:Gfo/Idh/MocA family protein n=1 Tax=Piscinibacter sp. TaxID=1903157 RepID=UPI0011D6701A|nr:MAG: Gfo/Idh/MocA family oxidoreductase [Burkholderiaceae bacterium]HNJ82258.1 Gfo/Idh/MocA family oxidoreductase [Piscinibacter sp.]HNK17728.1 Gfo/Idh/MocA family oxidoreductase [Piscinibacter sp.]